MKLYFGSIFKLLYKHVPKSQKFLLTHQYLKYLRSYSRHTDTLHHLKNFCFNTTTIK